MDLGVSGRGAFVVGATGDIGRATVENLLAEGARVVVGSRSNERMAKMFDSGETQIHGMVEIDLRNDASTIDAASRAEEILGGIDLLICTAAGDVSFGSVWDMTRENFESDYALKVVGISRLCTIVAERMVERKDGAIVNVIGINTDIVVTSNPAGSATNSALRSFTRVLAAEVAKAGVRVVGLSPGFVAGKRLARFAGDAAEKIRQSIPLGYLGTPREIADVIVFLASPRASYMTGSIVTVDGGATLR